MKQIYQFVTLLCFIPIGLLAQYSQSFDSATMPADWTIINGGDPGTQETFGSYDSSFNAPLILGPTSLDWNTAVLPMMIMP